MERTEWKWRPAGAMTVEDRAAATALYARLADSAHVGLTLRLSRFGGLALAAVCADVRGLAAEAAVCARRAGMEVDEAVPDPCAVDRAMGRARHCAWQACATAAEVRGSSLWRGWR